jgi:pimeloyl-ACP methyl ester carboxylesterase
MSRLVLVHGAFGGAWVWEPVLDDLRGAGHTVEALDLPGAGKDSTPVAEVSLDGYGERICGVLGEGPPAVLVGQSMGGMAITQAAARCPDRVTLLVYVGAFSPREGQSLTDLVAYPEAADDQVQANLVVQGDPPVAILPPEAAKTALYNCATEEQAQWGAEGLGPQPLAPFQQKVTVPPDNAAAFAALPRAYMVCRQDRAIPLAMQQRMITETACDPVVEIDTDHWPWLSRKEEFLAALRTILDRAPHHVAA